MSTTDETPTRRPARFEPPLSEVSRPFWDATREQRLILQWCVDCDEAIFYPREVCPRCMGSALEWRPTRGRGSVYAVTVENKPQNPRLLGGERFAIALVDLVEGVRMMTNVVGCAPDDVRVDMPVTLIWEELSDGRHLPLFTPLTES